MKETALLVLSGKILDRPFDLDALDSIRSAIEKSLSDRGVVVVRRVVTLGGERQTAAPFFLSAGFEAIPADDEDVQAATTIFAAAAASTPPDEIVFMTGIVDPVNLLRSIAGRTRRVLLRMDDSNDALSDELGFALESVLSIRELLSKEGVNWSQLNLRTWDQWAQEFGALMPDYGGRNADESETSAPVEREADAPAEKEPPAEIAVQEALTPIEVTTFSAVAEEPSAPIIATATVPDGAERDESPERADAGASDYVDDLIRSPDLYSEFARTAPEWNAALEEFLLGKNLKYSAFKATEYVDRQFPGLNEFYMLRPDEFRNLLGDKLRLVAGDESNLWLYHADHPEMRPASASDAAALLTLGSGFVDAGATDYSSYEFEDGAGAFETFREITELFRRQCETSAKLSSVQQEDSYYAEELRQVDGELFEEAKRLGVYLWPRSRDCRLSSEKLLKASEFYGLASKSALLTQNVESASRSLGASFVERVCLNFASVYCLLKSALRQYGVSTDLDRISSTVRQILAQRLSSLFGREYARLKWNETLDLVLFTKIAQDYETLFKEYRERVSNGRGRDLYLQKLKFHVLRIQNHPGQANLDDWNKVVTATTELCERFGEPYSSLALRSSLSDVVDGMPVGVNMTLAFERVVQEIRLNQVKKEEFVGAFSFDIVDKSPDSPETVAARKRYAGSKVAFIGNDRNVNARERIEKAFDVELIWFMNDEKSSLDVFSAYLHDPQVKLFLAYLPKGLDRRMEELAAAVGNAGKDFVRLEKGLNPNHVAHVICEQFNLLETP